MQLPQLESPSYQLTIPSSGELIEYRPFLVKEEKILLIAQETGTSAAMTAALRDIIKACTYNKLDVYSFTMSDLEYIFLNLRAKSVGESSTISIKCSECSEFVNITIDLTEVQVIKSEEVMDNKIELTNDVGVILKAPGLKEMEKASRSKNNNPISESIEAVIESIYDSEQVYPLAEATPKDTEAFIDSLTHGQTVLIQKWIENMPKLEHKIEFTCKNGHKNERTLSGLADFFV